MDFFSNIDLTYIEMGKQVRNIHGTSPSCEASRFSFYRKSSVSFTMEKFRYLLQNHLGFSYFHISKPVRYYCLNEDDDSTQEVRRLLKVSRALEKEISILPERPVIMVIGEIDTGKSTLVAVMAAWFWERGKKVAVVDSDIGQSDIGPPGFVSYGFAEGPILSLKSVKRQGSYMVGKTSPYGRELSVLVGVQSCVKAAKDQGADVILVDTCGLVRPTAGVQLKCAKAQAIEADVIISLRTPEVVPLIESLRSLDFKVKEFKPLSGARNRSAQERAQNRVCLWNGYLGREARSVAIDPSGVRVLKWWGESRYSETKNPNGWIVAAVPDPNRSNLQIPCILIKSEENMKVLGQLPKGYFPHVVWVSSYELGVDAGRVTSA